MLVILLQELTVFSIYYSVYCDAFGFIAMISLRLFSILLYYDQSKKINSAQRTSKMNSLLSKMFRDITQEILTISKFLSPDDFDEKLTKN